MQPPAERAGREQPGLQQRQRVAVARLGEVREASLQHLVAQRELLAHRAARRPDDS